jgi:hypothetical protein
MEIMKKHTFLFARSVNPLKLEYEHAHARKTAMETFAKNSRPFGGRQAEEGRKHLEADLEAQLSLFKERNSAKKMTARIRTGLDQLRQVLNQFYDQNIIRGENKWLVFRD